MAKQSRTAILTHYGRKSGQAYRVTIWFAAIDGCIWVGSPFERVFDISCGDFSAVMEFGIGSQLEFIRQAVVGNLPTLG